jgi:hypothetical protein
MVRIAAMLQEPEADRFWLREYEGLVTQSLVRQNCADDEFCGGS